MQKEGFIQLLPSWGPRECASFITYSLGKKPATATSWESPLTKGKIKEGWQLGRGPVAKAQKTIYPLGI